MNNFPYHAREHAADVIEQMFDKRKFLSNASVTLRDYVAVDDTCSERFAHLVVSSLRWSINEDKLMDVIHMYVVMQGGVFPVEWRDALGANRDEADEEIERYHEVVNGLALDSMCDAALQVAHDMYGAALPNEFPAREDVVECLRHMLLRRERKRKGSRPSHPRWSALHRAYMEWWDRQTGVMEYLFARLTSCG
jgi:hypothetical protein